MSTTSDVLQRAFESDPDAIRSLIVNRVPCNRQLADDPFVQVDLDANLHGEHFSVGAIASFCEFVSKLFIESGRTEIRNAIVDNAVQLSMLSERMNEARSVCRD